MISNHKIGVILSGVIAVNDTPEWLLVTLESLGLQPDIKLYCEKFNFNIFKYILGIIIVKFGHRLNWSEDDKKLKIQN